MELATVTPSRDVSVSAARREEVRKSRRRSVWQEAESVQVTAHVTVENVAQTVHQVGIYLVANITPRLTSLINSLDYFGKYCGCRKDEVNCGDVEGRGNRRCEQDASTNIGKAYCECTDSWTGTSCQCPKRWGTLFSSNSNGSSSCL